EFRGVFWLCVHQCAFAILQDRVSAAWIRKRKDACQRAERFVERRLPTTLLLHRDGSRFGTTQPRPRSTGLISLPREQVRPPSELECFMQPGKGQVAGSPCAPLSSPIH